MLSLSSLPPVSILSMYTTFAAAMMLIRTILTEVQTLVNQLLPQHLRDKLMSKFGDLSFQKMQLDWNFHSVESQKSYYDDASYEHYSQKCELKSAELSFHSKYKDMVMSTNLPYIVERSKAIKEEQRAVKLYAQGSFGGQYDGGHWGSVNLDHPSTFDTMAMDPEVKKELIEDLDRFVKRREFYRRVGKAWKRGYFLYGPPGTGKSSLIAAMANYLKFDIYDVELSYQQSNSDLRDLLATTKNQSILVIEDIDCEIELQDRSKSNHDSDQKNTKLTLSGLLNFIDGLWSSCGDERIIVFTTNYKERLDPALLRPGRMDKHIHMSYCTPCGFKVLANNYLQIKTHKLFDTIEQLIMEVEVTPAEVAEELMVSEDVEVVLVGLVQFLQMKKKQTKPCPEAEPTNGEDEQVIEGNK